MYPDAKNENSSKKKKAPVKFMIEAAGLPVEKLVGRRKEMMKKKKHTQ